MSHDGLESSDAILIPKPLKTTCFEACREVVPNLFGIRDWFHGRQFFPGLGRVGMAFVSLISCRVAQFLTDHGQVAIHGPGGWGPLLSWLLSFLVFCNGGIIYLGLSLCPLIFLDIQ